MKDFVCLEKTGVIKMGKIRQWFRKWFDRQLEKSFQRQADRLFNKYQKKDNA